ncbi:MAG: ExeA family protein [Polyangiaceae bacterium]|jgi:type II secretory pathway predicted ATPase ExeA
MYRKRFGLTGHPMPKDAQGKTFFDKSPAYDRLTRSFQHLLDEPGLGVLTGEPGVGKTAAIRNICMRLPKPDYLVVYLCDTAVSPLDLYRTLAVELGVRPSHRRAQLWTDIKKALIHMVDERSTAPVVIVDEAQHLGDQFLLDLSGFLNFAFDSRDLLTMWLVGLPALKKTLARQEHAALAMRVSTAVHFEPFTDKDGFVTAIAASLAAVGAGQKILAEPAMDLLFRQSRGFLRIAARLLRSALRLAHEHDQSFVDEPTMALAVDELLGPGPRTQKA